MPGTQHQRTVALRGLRVAASCLSLMLFPIHGAEATTRLGLNESESIGCHETTRGIELLPVVYEAAEGCVAIEAEVGIIEPYYDITRDKSGGVKAGDDASGAAYVDFVKHARYTFVTKTPGTYTIWYRCSVPSESKWVHNERVDRGQVSEWVLAVLPGRKNVDKWGWVKGYTYELQPGLHELELPIGFRGGPKLDKIELVGPGRPATPRGAGAKPGVGHVKRVRIVTRKCDIQGALTGISCPGLAEIVAELTLSVRKGQEWHFLGAGLDIPRTALADIEGVVDFRIDAQLNTADAGTVFGPIEFTVVGDERERVPLSVGDGSLTTTFDSVTGHLCGLSSVKYASQYIRAGASYIPFGLTLLREPVGESTTPFAIAPTAVTCTAAETRRGELRLTYALTEFDVRAEIRVRPLEAGQWEWTITVRNRDRKVSVLEVEFPTFDGLAIGESSLDDTVLYPTMDTAAHNFLVRYDDVSQPFVRPYPVGGELAMGFVDIHDADNGGFYLAVADRECPITMVGLAQGALRGWDLRMTKLHRIRPGQSRTYSYRVGSHDGNWRVPADWYRAMMDEMFDMLPAPALVRDSIGYLMIGSELNHYINSGAHATLARRLQLGWVQNWWSVNAPFVPCPLAMLGGEDALRRAATYAQSIGCPLGSGTALYATQRNYKVDGNLWNHRVSQDHVTGGMPQVDNVETFTRRTQIDAAPWDRNYHDLGWKTGMSIDYTQPEAKRVYDGWVTRYAEEYGSAPIYTDTGISLASAPCFNLEHGHFGYGLCGDEAMKGFRRLTRKSRGKNPNMYLICEGFLDRLAYMTGNLVHRHEVKNWIFQTVFPEQKSFCGLSDTNSRPLSRNQGDMLAPFIDPFVMGYHLAGRPNHDSWRVRKLFSLRRQLVEWLADARYREYVETEATQYSVLDVADADGRDGVLILYENKADDPVATLELDTRYLAGVTGGVRIDMDGGADVLEDGFAGIALGRSRAGAIILARKPTKDGAVLPVLVYTEDDESTRLHLTLCNLSDTTQEAGVKAARRADTHVENRTLQPRSVTQCTFDVPYDDLQGLTKIDVDVNWHCSSGKRTGRGAWSRAIACGPILLNGGFENDDAFPLKPDAWEHYGGFQDAVLLNRNVAHSGTGGLLLMTYSRDAQAPRLYQHVMLEPATKYTLDGWLRSAFFRDATDPVLNVELSYTYRSKRGDKSEKATHRHMIRATRVADWEAFSVDFETPVAYDVEVPMAKLSVLYKSIFALRIDDLRVRKRAPARE